MRIQFEHVLHGYENVAAATRRHDHGAGRARRAGRRHSIATSSISRSWPQRKSGASPTSRFGDASRISPNDCVERATGEPGGYPDAGALVAELHRRPRRAERLESRTRRQRRGAGLHLAGRDIRISWSFARSPPAQRGACGRRWPRNAADQEVAHDVKAGEVLETFRAIADIQSEFGEPACHRYVISFTHEAIGRRRGSRTRQACVWRRSAGARRRAPVRVGRCAGRRGADRRGDAR